MTGGLRAVGKIGRVVGQRVLDRLRIDPSGDAGQILKGTPAPRAAATMVVSKLSPQSSCQTRASVSFFASAVSSALRRCATTAPAWAAPPRKV